MKAIAASRRLSLHPFIFSVLSYFRVFVILFGANIGGSHASDAVAKRLTKDGGFKQHLQWSPDGKKLLVTRIHEGKMALWIMNADGSDLKSLLELSPATPQFDGSWSHDSKKIVYVHDILQGTDGKLQINSVNAEGGESKVLIPHKAFEESPRWSPDGKRIAWVSTRDGNQEIYLADADGKNAKRLTSEIALDNNPSWSPDSKRLAFASGRTGNFEIHVMDANGGNVRRLTNHRALDYWPAWSPDGKHIAFTSNRDGNYDIYIMDAAGNGVRNLTRHPAQDNYATWSADGKRIAFISNRNGGHDVYLMEVNRNEPLTAAQPPDKDKVPAPGTTGNPDNVPFIGKRDPQGNPVRLAKATGHVSNYSENRIAPYTLPDPLITSDKRRVATAEMWLKQRRPEILKFFRDEIYGAVPENAPKVTWEVAATDDNARKGTAIMRRIVGRMGDEKDGPRMNLLVFTPAKAKGPVPVLLHLTFAARSGGRPPGGFDLVEETLRRGWGYAALGYTDIQPDRPNRWTEGVIGLTLKQGQMKPAANEWGTISAWAWGLSRTIDYFQTDKSVNAKQIAITGASRLGKTVLWASAQDQRVAAVFAAVPGEMGASLIRRDWGETLDDMAQNFGYQFAGNLQKWVGKWNGLSVDQHMLIALSAPRPVFVSGGIKDQWSDPKGQFLALAAAGPVYRLLGAKGLGVDQMPALDKPVADGSLAYHYHSSGHTVLPADWKSFFDFADRHYAAKDKQDKKDTKDRETAN